MAVAEKVSRFGPAEIPQEERQRYAWKRLQEWAPRSKVVGELMQRFGIGQTQAYADIRDLYETIAEQRTMSRKAEAAALVEQIDAEVEKLRDEDTEMGRAPVSAALSKLWDMRARLTGAYHDTTRVALLIATAKEITGLSDDQLEAAIDGVKKDLALPPGEPIEAEAVEKPVRAPRRAKKR